MSRWISSRALNIEERYNHEHDAGGRFGGSGSGAESSPIKTEEGSVTKPGGTAPDGNQRASVKEETAFAKSHSDYNVTWQDGGTKSDPGESGYMAYAKDEAQHESSHEPTPTLSELHQEIMDAEAEE